MGLPRRCACPTLYNSLLTGGWAAGHRDDRPLPKRPRVADRLKEVRLLTRGPRGECSVPGVRSRASFHDGTKRAQPALVIAEGVRAACSGAAINCTHEAAASAMAVVAEVDGSGGVRG